MGIVFSHMQYHSTLYKYMYILPAVYIILKRHRSVQSTYTDMDFVHYNYSIYSLHRFGTSNVSKEIRLSLKSQVVTGAYIYI